jgi:poly(3-hydroxybutyrate) depolymerase
VDSPGIAASSPTHSAADGLLIGATARFATSANRIRSMFVVILVGVHWRHGSAQDFYSGIRYASLADRYGFIVIYPSASSSDGCWDAHSQASLTHNGGSDSLGIVSMVRYVQSHYGGDANRVYATGHSSGGMMTNVLLGAYRTCSRPEQPSPVCRSAVSPARWTRVVGALDQASPNIAMSRGRRDSAPPRPIMPPRTPTTATQCGGAAEAGGQQQARYCCSSPRRALIVAGSAR